MLPLADAAVSRSEADWLVGINGTRAMTAFNSKSGGFFKTTVGPRADADAGHSWSSARRRLRSSSRAIIGKSSARSTPRRANTPGAGLTRSFRNRTRTATTQLKPERVWEMPARGSHPRQMPRQTRHRHRGKQADHIALAAALRFDQFAARGERAVWVSARRTRWAWRRRFTKGTRCSPIRARTRARCRRITSAR